MRNAFVWSALAAVGMVLSVLSCPGLAHRVNVFAYVEGDTVHVECSYSKSDRVRMGDIEVKNSATGKVYLTGKTDDQGSFTFPVPAQARADKADLQILLRAGEGHQNDGLVKADEYLAAQADCPTPPTPVTAPAAPVTAVGEPVDPAAFGPVDPAVASEPVDPAVGQAPPASPHAAKTPVMDAALLQSIVQTTVDATMEKKIAPLRKMLLEEKEKGPGLREIVGGIGYLVGIAGLLAYARSRKGRSGS